MSTLWDNLMKTSSQANYTSGMDAHLASTDVVQSVVELTDAYRKQDNVELPVKSGTRVSFVGWLESYMSYNNPPTNKQQGTVVTAKEGTNNVTSHNEHVFVKFDDGKLLAVHTSHLKYVSHDEDVKTASITLTALSDLDRFMMASTGQLVHKATKDLWSFDKDVNGNIVVERLYTEDGQPLKL